MLFLLYSALFAVHLGVDILNVVRHVSRILEGRMSDKPFEFAFDGDLLTIIERMVQLSGVQNVKITKVKGHADDDMVAVGRVRVEDRIGNDLTDRAAEFGRRRASDLVIDFRRRFLSACSSWYPVVLDLHRFFIAIARAAVNNDGCAGVALQPTVWSSGGPAKKRKVRVSAWEFARVLLVFGGTGPLVGLALRSVRMMLVFWPYSVGLLVKFCSFLSSLHWPSAVDDLGLVTFRLLNFLCCMSVGLVRGWSWRCLFQSRVACIVQFQCRLFLMDQALIFGDPAGFWVR